MAKKESSLNSDQLDDAPIELPILKRPPRNTKGKADDIGNFQTSGTSHQHIDPRFNSKVSGSNDPRHFIRNYSFINDLRNDEISQLKRALRKERDPEKQDQIRFAMNRIKNKVVDTHNKAKQIEVVDKLKSNQKAGGKNRRVFVKKSDIKKELIVSKFKELKETGKLSKYLERKRKKFINRDSKGVGSI